MQMRFGTKITWVVLLSAALAAVLAMCGLVVAKSVRAVGEFAYSLRLDGNGGSGSFNTFGPFANVGMTNDFTRVVNQDYPVLRGGHFSLSIPLGKVTVMQSTSAKTVHMQATFSIIAPVHNKAASQIHLSTTTTPDDVQVNWDSNGGMRQLKSADVTLVVPTNLNLSIDDSLGDIRIQGGKYSSLDVKSNLGAIAVDADVTQTLSLHDNLGSIAYRGTLANGSTMIDNLGSIQVNVVRRQAVQYNLTTDIGTSTVSFPSESIAQRGNNIEGSVNGPKPQSVLTCTNNMGSITLQGE